MMTRRESGDGDSDEKVYLGEKTPFYRWEEGYVKEIVIKKETKNEIGA